MENYGLALKVLRLHFKYTQREIADKVGVSNHAVSKWENGINQPDISTLRLILRHAARRTPPLAALLCLL